MTSRRRLYWACQILGWGLVYSVFVLIAVNSSARIGGTGWTWRVVVFLVEGYVLSIAATHVLHLVSSRRDWPSRSWGGLLARVIPTIIGLAFTMTLVGKALLGVMEAFFGPVPFSVQPTEPMPEVVVVSDTAFDILLFAAWAVVYYLAIYAFRARDAERDALALRASLAESRLETLRTQLDPHFLFNALNTVRALILEDPHEARRAVTLLSSLLRETLESGREATHPLADELALVRPYLDLEAIRFGDRLRVAWDIAPEAEQADVPALLLLTLVENAVKHGIARCEAGGEVRVRATTEADRLTITVESPVPSTASSADGTGTGLANARERLALLHGDAASLSLDLGDRTAVATARLPL